MGSLEVNPLAVKPLDNRLYMLNRIFNLAMLFVLHKLSFKYSSSSNLINTFDDLFRHACMSPITHLKTFSLRIIFLVVKYPPNSGLCLVRGSNRECQIVKIRRPYLYLPNFDSSSGLFLGKVLFWPSFTPFSLYSLVRIVFHKLVKTIQTALEYFELLL